eukprot:scaffold83955_cov30-Tisochrysis_lutea.AAC.1
MGAVSALCSPERLVPSFCLQQRLATYVCKAMHPIWERWGFAAFPMVMWRHLSRPEDSCDCHHGLD